MRILRVLVLAVIVLVLCAPSIASATAQTVDNSAEPVAYSSESAPDVEFMAQEQTVEDIAKMRAGTVLLGMVGLLMVVLATNKIFTVVLTRR